MKVSRKTLAACVAGGCLALAACSSSGGSSTASTASTAAASGTASAGHSGSKNVAAFMIVNNAFNTCGLNAMQTALSAAGYSLTTYYSPFELATMKADIQDAITRGLAGAIYQPQTPAEDTVALGQLKAANIPSAYYQAIPVAGTSPSVTLPPDYEQAGREAAEMLLKLDPGVKYVGFIEGQTGEASSDLPFEGITEELAAHGIKPVIALHGDFTSQTGTTLTQDMLTAHPNLQVIFNIGEDMSLASTRYIQTQGLSTKVIDVTASGSQELQQVKSGQMLGLMWAPLNVWGTDTGQSLVNAMQGKRQASTVDLSLIPVTKANVNSITPTCGA
jgi:ribose transport system substrate-binding protein